MSLAQPSAEAPPRADCPSVDGIAAFLEGLAAPSASKLVLEHLDHCSACRALVADSLLSSTTNDQPASIGSVLQTFAVGETVGARYHISRFIARGGMGEVYEASDTLLCEQVALKTIACTGLDDEKRLVRLRAEVQLARRVSHPNVCRIWEFGLHVREYRGMNETIPFFTMELLRGETLARCRTRLGKLPEVEAIPIITQVIDGLAAIHASGIVHRDLKPENVFVVGDATTGLRAVVTDFGLARPLAMQSTLSSSAATSVAGTPAYMAPEQATGGRATPAWDVYALGVLVFELLCGRPPFVGNSAIAIALERNHRIAPRLSTLNPEVTPALEAIVSRCLERDPARRYSNVDAVRKALMQCALDAGGPTLRWWVMAAWFAAAMLGLLLGYHHPMGR